MENLLLNSLGAVCDEFNEYDRSHFLIIKKRAGEVTFRLHIAGKLNRAHYYYQIFFRAKQCEVPGEASFAVSCPTWPQIAMGGGVGEKEGNAFLGRICKVICWGRFYTGVDLR